MIASLNIVQTSLKILTVFNYFIDKFNLKRFLLVFCFQYFLRYTKALTKIIKVYRTKQILSKNVIHKFYTEITNKYVK